MTRRRLLVATRSAHKLRELRELLDLQRTELVSLDDLGIAGDPIEDGETFETNAAIKARFGRADLGACRPWPTTPGLEVDALDGGPGVRTRRYAGRARHRRRQQRQAAGGPPRSAGGTARRPLCLRAGPGAVPESAGRAAGLAVLVTRGTCRGRIATEPRGSGGFGYDPIFEPAPEPPGGRTLGLWTPAEKHAISHRARAARRMAPRLVELGF